jgi:hypothetical protein
MAVLENCIVVLLAYKEALQMSKKAGEPLIMRRSGEKYGENKGVGQERNGLFLT